MKALLAFISFFVGIAAGMGYEAFNSAPTAPADSERRAEAQNQLASAIKKGDLNAIRAAVNAGADPNAPGLEGVTPLLHSLLDSQPASFACLLEVGANPDIAADNDASVWHVAAILPANGYLKALIAKKGKPTVLDGRRRTALHSAAQRGRDDNVRLLLDAGVNPNATDINGDTALHLAYAAPRPQAGIVETLRHGGANESLRNRYGRTPSDLAHWAGRRADVTAPPPATP